MWLCEQAESLKQVGVAIRDTCKAIKYPHVWKSAFFMFICLSLSISTHEGQFYWYTDKKAGPAFSQVFDMSLIPFYSSRVQNVMSISLQPPPFFLLVAGIGRAHLCNRLCSVSNRSTNLPQDA